MSEEKDIYDLTPFNMDYEDGECEVKVIFEKE